MINNLSKRSFFKLNKFIQLSYIINIFLLFSLLMNCLWPKLLCAQFKGRCDGYFFFLPSSLLKGTEIISVALFILG